MPSKPSSVPFSSYRFRHPDLVGSLFICAVIFTLYSVAFGHNFFFDEESIILKNPFIKKLSLIPELFRQGYFYDGRPVVDWKYYYRPLTSLTFALDYQFWQTNPLGYNLTNTILHCLVCVLLFRLFRKIFNHRGVAFLSAFLYSVHTIHTEAVTYIASRGDMLGALLCLGALFCYWEKRFKSAILFYFLALFSKESSILLPAYLVALDLCFIKSGLKDVLKKITPFIAVAALFLIYRKYFSPVPLGPPSNDLREAVLRVLSMGFPFMSYLQAIFLPEIFKFSLTIKFAKSFWGPEVLATVLVLTALLSAWCLTFRRRGAAFFGLSVFLIGLLPYLQSIHFYPEWAEHYLYVPSIGLAVLLGSLIKKIFESKKIWLTTVFFMLYVPFALFLCYRTEQRNALYNDTEQYFERLSKSDSPYAYFGYQNLGRIAVENGEWDKAAVPLKTAYLMATYSDVTQNLLGQYYLHKNMLPEALEKFNGAYQNSNQNDIYRINAAYTLIRMGRYEEAISILEEAQKRVPSYSSVYVNLLTAYELLNQPKVALEKARTGLQNTQAVEWEQVVIRMAMLRMAYRQGWDDVVQSQMDTILRENPTVFWYADVVKLFKGQTTPEKFLKITDEKFIRFRSSAKVYILISFMLQRQLDLIPGFLETNESLFKNQVKAHPLVRKEFERIRQTLAAHQKDTRAIERILTK